MNQWTSVRSKTAKGGVGRGKGLYDPTPEKIGNDQVAIPVVYKRQKERDSYLKINQEEKPATQLTSPALTNKTTNLPHTVLKATNRVVEIQDQRFWTL